MITYFKKSTIVKFVWRVPCFCFASNEQQNYRPRSPRAGHSASFCIGKSSFPTSQGDYGIPIVHRSPEVSIRAYLIRRCNVFVAVFVAYMCMYLDPQIDPPYENVRPSSHLEPFSDPTVLAWSRAPSTDFDRTSGGPGSAIDRPPERPMEVLRERPQSGRSCGAVLLRSGWGGGRRLDGGRRLGMIDDTDSSLGNILEDECRSPV